MEQKNIIIMLVAIIVVLAAIIGFMVLDPMHAKEPTKIKITSNKTLYEGDDLSVKLTDLNKTPLSKEKVNITVKNSKGKVVVNKTVKTNDKGNAKLNLDLKKGKYNVAVSYGGNENYTGNNTTQKLTIKEKVVEAAVEQVSSEYSSNDVQSEDSSGQTNGMPEETRKVYEARQRAADDGIPMYEYIDSPELVEKYQAMV